MIRNIYLTCVLFVFSCLGALAQTGAIKGKVIDKATKEPIPFATIVAEASGQQAGGAQSDFDGEYTIKPLQAGKYTIKVKFIGYNDIVINDVLVSVDKITYQDLALSKNAVNLNTVEVIEYKVPLIDKGNTSQGGTITREEIAAAPTRDVRSVASTTAGVLQKDDGDDVNVRGSRDDATDYYVDGVRIRGSKRLPQAGIEQVTIVTGGLPAQYGDATGGIISITTRGPSQEFAGGVELVTSELFDKYGYNLVSLNLSGPILGKKQADGSTRTLLGFFLSGEYQTERDPNPSAIGMSKLRDDLYDDLKAQPIIPVFNNPSAVGAGAYGYSAKPEYFRADDFEKVKVRNNVKQTGYRFTAKFDYQPVTNTTVTFGGTFDYNDRSAFDADFDPQLFLRRSMYNFNENPQIAETNYRVFGRITQKIGSTFGSEDAKNESTVKNVYISLQAEYTSQNIVNQDREHKDNLFAYGYVGKFDLATTDKRYTSFDTDAVRDSFRLSGYNYTYNYTPGDANPYTANYTQTAANFFTDFYNQSIASGAYSDSLLNVFGLSSANTVNALSVYQGAGGLRNGDAPGTVWSMWDNIGNPRNTYRHQNTTGYRITLNGNADIKDHALSLGFEFEQSIDRDYLIAPRGLWTQARQVTNSNFIAADYGQDSTVYQINGITYYDYPSGYTPSTLEGQTVDGFYEKLRKSLGLANNTYIDLDALSPDQLSVSMFSPDELITNNYITQYYGYDYTGEKFNENPTFKDFFTKKVNGSYTRDIGAFRPVYMAGYIQDKFAIDNLNFNVGLRVDRFDANQKQLKDKYLMTPAYTVGNVPGGLANTPGNIGDDFVPYFSVPNDYSTVIGYRDGDVWYDKDGRIVSNPDILVQQAAGSGKLFVASTESNPQSTFASKDWDIDNVFEDYTPQYSIMPRIAFSFPISDQALFFAHYDVLTQRPSSNLRLDPIDYFTLAQSAPLVNNGGLKPEKTTDYEIGFKQTVSKSSAVTISAFYRELKNQIQVRKLAFAYPYGYTTYDNIDFGTVKGLTLAYDMRRTGNLRLNASYTLQFADGTGSGANTNLELTQTDQPDIRIIYPLDFDQRHNLVASLDYRYQSGADYNGPIWFGKQFFANVGANFVFRVNSGTPYTNQSRPTQEANAIGWQDNGQRAVEGGLNGSRTPWQFRTDMRINKVFEVKIGSKKTADVEIYLQIQNLFSTKNVVNVYRVTGNAEDDGYIQSLDGQQSAESKGDPQAFVDQYNLKLKNPNNYSIPRRARLGVAFNF